MSDPNPAEEQQGTESWSCPLPLRDFPEIVMGHGGGGKLSAELVANMFLPAFNNECLATLGDSSVVDVGGQRIAFSTDSFVVRPLFFPGGNIGELAVNGTINDLAMSGASPLFLSAGLIVEEGLPLSSLAAIANAMGRAAALAGVQIVTGDTKVVEKGHGDGCYINTTGIGSVPNGRNVAPNLAQPGDAIILSGTIGDHGMAIMSVREGLDFEAPIVSDTTALHEIVQQLLAACPGVRVLRDPTRGGLASSLNEIAEASSAGMVIEEERIPIDSTVRSACEILGLDPMYVANEGKFVAIVPAEESDVAVETLRKHRLGKNAANIGHVTKEHPGMVVAKTGIGANRVVTMQIGEQLPRIC